MRRIIDLPKSGEKSIFEPSSDQYFYITNSEISRLGGFEITKSSFDDLSVFQVGYTNLWLMKRVLLLHPAEFRFEYEENSVQTGSIVSNDYLGRIGKYYLLGDNSYLSVAGSENSMQTRAFNSLAEAENYLLSLKNRGADKIFVAAKLLQDIYWH